MPARDVRVWRAEPDGHGDTARSWPLDALAAFLFDARACDDVRALLATGRGSAHGVVLAWEPMELSAAELTAIERGFPPPEPDRPADVRRASAALLSAAGAPAPRVSIRAYDPVVLLAAGRARYVRFDYGPWADVYEGPIPRGDALTLARDLARRADDAAAHELARSIETGAALLLHLEVPREGAPPPWPAVV